MNTYRIKEQKEKTQIRRLRRNLVHAAVYLREVTCSRSPSRQSWDVGAGLLALTQGLSCALGTFPWHHPSGVPMRSVGEMKKEF